MYVTCAKASKDESYVKVLDYLLSKGADPYKTTEWVNETPLCIAIKRNMFDITKILLEKGVDIKSAER